MPPAQQTDIAHPQSVEQQRDQVLEVLKDHLDEVAAVLEQIHEQDYSKHKFRANDDTTYTIKQEEGTVSWFRHDPSQTYLISTKGDPTPADLEQGLEDYPEFISAVNDWIQSQTNDTEAALETVTSLTNDVAEFGADTLIDKRDEAEEQLWDLADKIAAAVRDIKDDDYATLILEVDDETWKLKADGSSAKYLQVDGTYVLGRDSPRPTTLRKTVDKLDDWLDAVNAWFDRCEHQMSISIEITESST